MLEAVRTQIRIGAVSGSAVTAAPVGFNTHGQAVVYRTESERARRREIERRRRQKGLRR